MLGSGLGLGLGLGFGLAFELRHMFGDSVKYNLRCITLVLTDWVNYNKVNVF